MTQTKRLSSRQPTASELREAAYLLLRSDLVGFITYTFPGYKVSPHLEKLAAALEAVERGEVRRLLVTMPPRHGKSELVSVRFPAWWLGRNPDKRMVVAAYAADLAERFSRQTRGVIESERYQRLFPGIGLARDSRSVSAWDIAQRRGGLKAVGVGGPLTGHGANVLLIDDPLKNREEAQSAVVRQSVWDWYTSTAYTRLEEQGAVVVVMTRWHEDDLAGRLLEAEVNGGPHADRWTRIHFPAMSEAGEALWPEKYSVEDLAGIRANVGEYDWAALYQGHPTPREGAFFKVGMIEIVDALPANLRMVRGWDKAATEGAGDFTAGTLMGEAEGVYYIANLVHGQWDTSERDRVIRQTAELDGQNVAIIGEQEPSSGGKDAARGFIRLLAGFPVAVESSTTNKAARADALSAQVNAGNVRMLRAPWNRVMLEEMRTFPLGKHDDIVDSASLAFNQLARRRVGRMAIA